MAKPKTGGIQKGYVYPKTLEFKKRLDENGFYIVEEFIKLYNETDSKKFPFMKLNILQEMSKYCFAVPRDSGPTPEENTPGEGKGDDITLKEILTMIDVTPVKDGK